MRAIIPQSPERRTANKQITYDIDVRSVIDLGGEQSDGGEKRQVEVQPTRLGAELPTQCGNMTGDDGRVRGLLKQL